MKFNMDFLVYLLFSSRNFYYSAMTKLYLSCLEIIHFPITGVHCGSRHHRRQSNELIIKPEGPHVKAVGKNLFFTCKANVPNPKLVKDLKWYKSNGESIPEDDR